jgi:hypothetical protein
MKRRHHWGCSWRTRWFFLTADHHNNEHCDELKSGPGNSTRRKKIKRARVQKAIWSELGATNWDKIDPTRGQRSKDRDPESDSLAEPETETNSELKMNGENQSRLLHSSSTPEEQKTNESSSALAVTDLPREETLTRKMESGKMEPDSSKALAQGTASGFTESR